MAEARALTTADGVVLEAEWSPAPGRPRAVAVLCHPHPRHGGTMRSVVTGALFAALPPAGVSCLRFNFRGVEGSGGAWGEGDAERHDVRAAIAEAARSEPDRALLLSGWSFGADLALSVHDPAVSGWLAVACPLRWARDLEGLARDPRPKQVVLAEHDEFRGPAEVAAAVAGWATTTVDVVAGASHFFIGRTAEVERLAMAFVDTLTATN